MQNRAALARSGGAPQARLQGHEGSLSAPYAGGSGHWGTWSAEASELERLLPCLAARVQEGGRELRAARREVAEERSLRDSEANELAVAQRRVRVAEARLAEEQGAARAEQEARRQRERDNRGLRRTYEGLQQRLAAVEEEVAQQAEAVAEQEVEVDTSRVEVRSLQSAIGGMPGTAELLEERVASERGRKERLQTVARARLQQEIEARRPLQQESAAAEAEVAGMRTRVEAREAGLRAVAAEIVELREAARGGRSQAQRHLDERRALQLELRERRAEHGQLRGELVETEARLAQMVLEGREARREFCSKYMEAVDARAEARRSWDRDIVVAEEG